MPIGYHPQHFWAVFFARTGSAWSEPSVWWRSFSLLPIPISLALLHYFSIVTSAQMDDAQWLVQDISLPFSVLVGLMTSFRLSDAFRKWERASLLLLTMHQDMRSVMSQLCAYLPGDEESVVARVKKVRRLLLLGCFCVS